MQISRTDNGRDALICEIFSGYSRNGATFGCVVAIVAQERVGQFRPGERALRWLAGAQLFENQHDFKLRLHIVDLVRLGDVQNFVQRRSLHCSSV